MFLLHCPALARALVAASALAAGSLTLTPAAAQELPQEWSGFVLPSGPMPGNGPAHPLEWARLSLPANSLGLPALLPADRAWLQAAQAGRWDEVAASFKDPELDLNLSVRDPVTGASVLALAARAGQTELLRGMLRRGAFPDQRGADGQTALAAAAYAGHALAVQALLKAGADPELMGPTGEPALHTACITGHPAVIDILLQAGVDPAFENRRGEPAFIVAARYGQIAAMERLIAAGWDPQRTDRRGLNALHAAAAGYQGEAAAWLQARGLPQPSALTGVLLQQTTAPELRPVIPPRR